MADLPVRAARAGVTIRIVPPGEVAGLAPVRRGAVRRALQRQRHMAARSRGEVAADARAAARPAGRQAAILDAAAPLVGAGGRLVYMTCSLLRAENEDQVAAFVERTPAGRWSHRASTRR
jgi:16S rRNA (cytosine967-C5)-methyltransferase